MTRKLLFGLLIFTLVVLPLLAACAKPAPTTPTPTTPTPTPTTPTPTKPVELVVSDHNPAASGPGKALDYWAEQVQAQAGGRLKLTVYHGGALLATDEAYRGVQGRIADIAHYALQAKDGFYLNSVVSLPFLGWPTQHMEDKYMALLDKFPEMKAEWKGVTIISVMMMPPTHIHTAKKAIKTPADLKGIKIGSRGAMVETMNAVGAAAVDVAPTDWYVSLDRGLLEGIANHFPVLNVFGVTELLPYHTVFGEGGIDMMPMYLIMNTDVLNSLPSDLKQLIIDSGHIWYEKFCELDAADQLNVKKICEDKNHTFTYLTPEEIAVWYDLVKKPVHDKWIKDCADKGLPAQAVYDEALRLAKE
jgi:TRAP-type C4-dicarboxylate transport system substrate-binding protein